MVQKIATYGWENRDKRWYHWGYWNDRWRGHTPWVGEIGLLHGSGGWSIGSTTSMIETDDTVIICRLWGVVTVKGNLISIRIKSGTNVVCGRTRRETALVSCSLMCTSWLGVHAGYRFQGKTQTFADREKHALTWFDKHSLQHRQKD